MTSALPPGPQRVQIQTQSGCNGRCVFCPNEETLKAGISQGKMPETLFQKIIDDLAQTNPNRVSLYLMNEPMADKRLPEFIQYTAERIPETSTLVTTNGTYLNEERAEAMINAGLKRLKVSLQSLDPERNREIMGYSSEKVIEGVLATKRVMDRMRSKKFDLRVSMVVTKQNRGEISEARKFWRRHGVRLVTSALENRGGNIANAEEMNDGEMKLRDNCIRPSREMCILYNGDVALCCVDWHRRVILGNVAERHVAQVWNDHPVEQIRQGFRERKAELLPDLCLNCTESACADGHRRGIRSLFRKLAASF